MAATEADPLSELRDELNADDEPLFAPAAAQKPQPASAPQSAPPPAAPPGPPPLPPPLPRRALTQTGSLPVATALIAASPGPAAAVPPTQYQVTGLPALPPQVQRPAGPDPFQELPEPRLPPGADPEEKLRVFRAVIKGKDEALTRGRALVAALDAEAQQLRALATQLRAQVEVAAIELQKAQEYPPQLALLREQLERATARGTDAEHRAQGLVARAAEVDAERRTLASALAGLEAQTRTLGALVEEERRAREQLTAELASTREAAGVAHERVTDLTRRLTEGKALYEGAVAEVNALSAHRDQSERDLVKASEGLRATSRERDELARALETAQLEAQSLKQLADALEQRLGDAESRLETAAHEQAWSRTTLEQTSTRARALEGELEAARADLEAANTERGESRKRIEALEARLKELQGMARSAAGTLQNQLHAANTKLQRLQDADARATGA
ncbi:MAG: hypothetical protein INH37_10300, partial [Myxococcaceae bacterium]|nr:hypothetical protein [Myxococcaceae bacterium]